MNAPKRLALCVIGSTLFLPALAMAGDPVTANGADQQPKPLVMENPCVPLGLGATDQPDPIQPPKGLSHADWSGIRGEYERHRHAVVANPDGSLQARNPGQTWLTKFDGSGFTLAPDSGGWFWGLELEGHGKVLEVRTDGGKVSYLRENGLTEWFVNDSRGLEQGWTLAKRPEHTGKGGLLRLRLAVRGGLLPRISEAGDSVAFARETGDAALTYGGLKAWDADGKPLDARFEASMAEESLVSILVDDSSARYPIIIDPIAQQAYLKASNTGSGDRFGVPEQFGASVAVSGDTVVVGALGEDSSATGVNGNQADSSESDSGAAYVFVRNGATWIQQAYLKASNTGANDYFGSSVAVSGDTVVVGAPGEGGSVTGVNGNQTDNSASDSGAAYVFIRNGATWTQQAYLKASNTGASDNFGLSVAAFGDTVIVGAFGERSGATGINGNQDDDSSVYSGAAYVFVRDGTAWTQQAYLKASNTGVDDQFGVSVAVSGDTAVVGAPYGSVGVGSAYVFSRSGTVWTQQACLNASNAGMFDFFGWSVAVSGDTVVVGAASESSGATGVNGDQSDNLAKGSGAAYVFVRDGTVWTQQAYLKASNTGANDHFGSSVAVSGDTVVVGADNEASYATGLNGNQTDNSASDSGAAYVFVRDATAWTQQAYLKASNTGAKDFYGRSVAISGTTVLVGAPGEDSSSSGVNPDPSDNSCVDSGAVYVFSGVGACSLVSASANGTIDGSGDYPRGATAVAIATPAPGYVFTGWTGDASGTDNPLSILMNSDKTIGATFTRQFTLTTSNTTNGEISGVAANGKYLIGTIATLSAIPAAGYVFTGWNGAFSGTTNPLTITMDADMTIGATFQEDLIDGCIIIGTYHAAA